MTTGPDDNPLMNRRPDELLPVPAPPPAAASEVAPADTLAPTATITEPAPSRDVTPAAAQPTPKPKSAASASNTKDTLESIIIALIFALTFRAFLVEAFVIPTASMAPTLLGAHARVICPKCGYEFDQNVSIDKYYDDNGNPQYNTTRDLFTSTRFLTTRDERFSGPEPMGSQTRRCPNCGYRIDGSQLPELINTLTPRNLQGPEYFAWTNNGDRILVMKYLYSIVDPKRWDVIVFKEPTTARDNYIKRLIGLPGETVEVIGGDVFIRAAGAPATAPELIQRKPDDVQNAVWQLVYDNDHYPIDEGKPRPYGIDERDGRNYIVKQEVAWHTPWRGQGATASNWLPQSPIIEYTVDAPGKLRFAPSDVTLDDDFYFKNIAGYNNDLDNGDRLVVPDLHLECAWSPTTVAPISLTLGVAANRYRATIDGDGQTHLDQWIQHENAWTAIDLHQPAVTVARNLNAIDSGRTYRLAYSNVDHRVQLLVNGTVILDYAPQWTDTQQRRFLDNIARGEMPMVAIDVAGRSVFTHVKLLRDLYYTDSAGGYPGRGVNGHPETIGDDEYFALGDNSVESSDSRLWTGVDLSLYDLPVWKDYRPGHVPKRFMLGKAFFVYWPAGYRPIDALPYPLIPDVGHMRMIR
jgi:signal peptidase I